MQAAAKLRNASHMLEAAVTGLLQNAGDLVSAPKPPTTHAVHGDHGRVGDDDEEAAAEAKKPDPKAMKMLLLRGSMSALEVRARSDDVASNWACIKRQAHRLCAVAVLCRTLSRLRGMRLSWQVALRNDLKDLLNTADVRNFFEDMCAPHAPHIHPTCTPHAPTHAVPRVPPPHITSMEHDASTMSPIGSPLLCLAFASYM